MQIEFRGKPGYLAWLYDITDRKRIEDATQYLAYHDALTNLPNRILLRDRLQQALVVAERDQTALAVIFVDLDHFKSVNDSYGHDFGDCLLQESAKRIRACLRKSDSVARIGGDEFVVLLPAVKTSQHALTVAKQIQRALDKPAEIDGHTVHISGSIGLALYPEHAANDRDLITRADTAMYYAKAEGRNRVQLYQAGMEDDRNQPPVQPTLTR
jgi:diguanylate cyclase (GGDEF)-like protein